MSSTRPRCAWSITSTAKPSSNYPFCQCTWKRSTFSIARRLNIHVSQSKKELKDLHKKIRKATTAQDTSRRKWQRAKIKAKQSKTINEKNQRDLIDAKVWSSTNLDLALHSQKRVDFLRKKHSLTLLSPPKPSQSVSQTDLDLKLAEKNTIDSMVRKMVWILQLWPLTSYSSAVERMSLFTGKTQVPCCAISKRLLRSVGAKQCESSSESLLSIQLTDIWSRIYNRVEIHLARTLTLLMKLYENYELFATAVE